MATTRVRLAIFNHVSSDGVIRIITKENLEEIINSRGFSYAANVYKNATLDPDHSKLLARIKDIELVVTGDISVVNQPIMELYGDIVSIDGIEASEELITLIDGNHASVGVISNGRLMPKNRFYVTSILGWHVVSV